MGKKYLEYIEQYYKQNSRQNSSKMDKTQSSEDSSINRSSINGSKKIDKSKYTDEDHDRTQSVKLNSVSTLKNGKKKCC